MGISMVEICGNHMKNMVIFRPKSWWYPWGYDDWRWFGSGNGVYTMKCIEMWPLNRENHDWSLIFWDTLCLDKPYIQYIYIWQYHRILFERFCWGNNTYDFRKNYQQHAFFGDDLHMMHMDCGSHSLGLRGETLDPPNHCFTLNISPATPWFAHTQTTHQNNKIYLSAEDEWKHWLYAVILTLSFQDLGF